MLNNNYPISEKTISEIMLQYAQAPALPSDQAISELASASGISDQSVRGIFTRMFAQAGGEGDPWGMPNLQFD